MANGPTNLASPSPPLTPPARAPYSTAMHNGNRFGFFFFTTSGAAHEPSGAGKP